MSEDYSKPQENVVRLELKDIILLIKSCKKNGCSYFKFRDLELRFNEVGDHKSVSDHVTYPENNFYPSNLNAAHGSEISTTGLKYPGLPVMTQELKDDLRLDGKDLAADEYIKEELANLAITDPEQYEKLLLDSHLQNDN